jgi:TP901 family phage tail tape measure protein
MTSAGKKMSMTVTAPIVGLGTAAVVMANDFEASMAKIEGLVGIPADEIRGMQDQLVGLASQYGASANEAAEAMFFITSAGLRGSDAMDVLEASLKGAAVGLGDVSTIADLATSAMNAYGAEVLSAEGATDVLAAAVREGKLEAAELTGAMGQVLPIASAMGVRFDEVGAAMAAMSRTGTNAAQASTQLRGILNSLLKPTKQAEAAMAGMGLSSEGLRQQIKDEGLLATLETLTQAFDGNEAATAAVFGNVRALAGVLDLMGANVDTTRDIFDNMSDSAGIMNEAFGAAADTGAFKIKQAVASLKNSLMELGQIIAPVVAEMAEKFKELVDRFAALDPAAKKMIVTVAGIAAAIGPLLIVAGQAVKAIGAMAGALTFLLAHPVVAAIVAIVLAIAALVVGIKYAYDNFEGFRNFVQATWEGIQAAVQTTVDFFTGTVWPMMQKVFQDIQTVALLLWENGIKPAWEGIQEAVGGVVANFMEYVWPNIEKVFAFIGEAATALYEDFIKPNWEKIEAAIAPVVAWLETNVVPILTVAFQALGKTIAILAGALGAYWSTIFKIIGPVIGWLVDYVGPVVMGVWRLIWTGLSALVDFTLFYWKAIVTVVGAAVDFFMSYVWPALSSVFSNVIRGAQAVWQGIQAAFSAITGFISSAVGVIGATLGRIAGVVTTVIGFFLRLRSAIIEQISGVISNVASIPGRILGALGSLGSLLYNAGRNVISGLIRGLQSMFNNVRDWFGNLTSSITSWKGPESVDRRLLRRSGQLIMDGFITGLESRRGDVRASLESLTREVGAFSPDLGSGRLMRISAAVPTISPAPASTGGASGGIHIENLNVTAAPGEQAATSVPRQLRRMAWVAGLDG